ncbi:alpha-aminoadipate--lysW ligase [Sulfodiicoccus acidiphilus]|uniref:Alpha-aminoadipate--lysW ligase n=1 Tax=Sulfodiicoccus acidiphilus TaxID=1670455 RepID=A0A348B2Q7_9CREN|nr:lysine biosynthesis protein LysX [Sulfodiicoccus acidiphilus]BBD72459.1 alpha-aminoadipate--lysW ligase [Sulfodiicoccus acidiphilus]GGT96986.1 alpha-aminoadipate--lysW ligase [Sulfodiicoccus acidiphilus]
MRLALAYDILRWEERDILEKGRRVGIDVRPVHLDEVFFSMDKEGVRVPSIGEADAVLQRSISHTRAYLTSALMEGAGYCVFNSSFTIERAGNKAIASSLLARRGIPTPRTVVGFHREVAIKAAAPIGFPLVIKPVEGSWGRMTAKAENEDSLLSLMEYQEGTSMKYKSVFYLQQFVRKPGRDLRIFVIGDDVPVGIYRINDSNWRTNTALGAKAEPVDINGELRELALKTKDVFGGVFLGVDVFEDPSEGYLVNEVNTVPEYKNTARVTGYDITSAILGKLKEEIKK